jgi:hypothetical protein
MNKRAYLIAAVNAELKAKLDIDKFDKEFSNGNQNNQGNGSAIRQDNNAQGNVPQQPQYGG